MDFTCHVNWIILIIVLNSSSLRTASLPERSRSSRTKFALMPLKRKGLLGAKLNENTLERNGNPILNRKQGINFYSCSKNKYGMWTVRIYGCISINVSLLFVSLANKIASNDANTFPFIFAFNSKQFKIHNPQIKTVDLILYNNPTTTQLNPLQKKNVVYKLTCPFRVWSYDAINKPTTYIGLTTTTPCRKLTCRLSDLLNNIY